MLESLRSYALHKLAAADREAAIRARHAAALLTLVGRAEQAQRTGSTEFDALVLAEMPNVRDAWRWAMRHDAHVALELAIASARFAVFTPWRHEAATWLLDGEPLLDQVGPELQMRWWRHCAQQLVFRNSPRAVDAARRAIALSRALGDEEILFWSVLTMARSFHTPEGERDALVAEMNALRERHPEWPLNAHLAALGTLLMACHARRDYEGALRHGLEELAYAERGGSRVHAGVAEHNIANALTKLGRHEEALGRVQACLRRAGDDASPNTAYLHVLATRTLLDLGRLDEALAGASAVLAQCRAHHLPDAADLIALAAALDGRPRTSALLLGAARRSYADHGSALPTKATEDYVRALALVRERLDDTQIELLAQRGERLDGAAAERLLLERSDSA